MAAREVAKVTVKVAVASVTVRVAGASVVATVVERKGAGDEEMVAVPEVVEVAEVHAGVEKVVTLEAARATALLAGVMAVASWEVLVAAETAVAATAAVNWEAASGGGSGEELLEVVAVTLAMTVVMVAEVTVAGGLVEEMQAAAVRMAAAEAEPAGQESRGCCKLQHDFCQNRQRTRPHWTNPG